MNKLRGYGFLFSDIIYTSWEWLFLFSGAFFLISFPHGGIISSVLFFTGAVVRIMFAKRVGAFLQTSPALTKLKISFLSRIGLLISLVGLAALRGAPTYMPVLWITVASFLFLVDGYASLDLRYILAKHEHFSFARIGAFSNIGKRGSIAITSIIALQLPTGHWHLLALTLSVPFLVGIISMGSLIYITSRDQTLLPENIDVANNKIDVANNKIDVQETEEIDIRLIVLYLFAFNLFFGSNGLMIIKAISIYNMSFYSISPLTLFYTSFVATNAIAMIVPKLVESFVSWTSIATFYVATAFFCIAYWLFRDIKLMFMLNAIIFGAIYAFQAICIFSKVSSTIKGANQTKYLAKIDVVGKVGFISSQLLVGLLLDGHIDPLILSAGFGVCSLLAFFVYYFIFQGKDKRIDVRPKASPTIT